jgi:hypothetical protein
VSHGLPGVSVSSPAVNRPDRPAFAAGTETTVRPPIERIRAAQRWVIVIIATIVTTGALDALATAAGLLLAASPVLDGASHGVVLSFLAATYLLWIVGLRVNVIANWCLLEQMGTSTNLLSKLMFELARCRSDNRRIARAASAAGYLIAEIAKEAPYYAGAFGTALLSHSVDATDALVFLAGTNIGAAAYELGVARLSRLVLARRAVRCGNPMAAVATSRTRRERIRARRPSV